MRLKRSPGPELSSPQALTYRFEGYNSLRQLLNTMIRAINPLTYLKLLRLV